MESQVEKRERIRLKQSRKANGWGFLTEERNIKPQIQKNSANLKHNFFPVSWSN